MNSLPNQKPNRQGSAQARGRERTRKKQNIAPIAPTLKAKVADFSLNVFATLPLLECIMLYIFHGGDQNVKLYGFNPAVLVE